MDDSVYVGFDADYYAYPLSWARTEVNDDEFTWNALDNSLNFAQRFDGEVVLVVSCNARWACGGGTRAPNDLDRRTPLENDPPEHGYSESLYDFAYNVVNHIGQRENPVVKYLRFVNEPEYNWEVGRNYQQDVEDYVRCLRTFYIAAHAAADANEIEVHVSHGGFYLVKQLARKYYRIGEENAELQDSLITLLQSRFERHATRINTWEDVQRLVVGRGGMPPNYWSDVMAGQTEWLDWFDIHYHWKPRFIFEELGAFEEMVQDSGGEVKPWLAAEAAMQLAQGGLTDYEARFHAGDMVRKWISGIAFGLEGICTPMTGFPPEHFFGLFDDQQQEYLSATSFRFLRSIIQPTSEPKEMSEYPLRAFRFEEEIGLVDVFWYDALFDTDESEFSYYPVVPEEFRVARVFDILGEEIDRFEPGEVDTLRITQVPVIINWDTETSIKRETDVITAQVELNSVFPNPFNSQFSINYLLLKSSSISIRLYTLKGTEVWSRDNISQCAGNHQITVNSNGMTSGLYFVEVSTGKSNMSRKILLLR